MLLKEGLLCLPFIPYPPSTGMSRTSLTVYSGHIVYTLRHIHFWKEERYALEGDVCHGRED